MKTLATAAAGAALIALALPGASQAQNAPFGIPGYLNPTTGLFTTRRELAPAASGLQRTGTIVVTITAILGSNIPKSVLVTCSVTLFASDLGFDNGASGSSVVTRSGKGGTCKIAIPYVFEIATAATTMNVTASLFAATSSVPTLTYDASFGFAPFAVPNGTKALAVTLGM